MRKNLTLKSFRWQFFVRANIFKIKYCLLDDPFRNPSKILKIKLYFLKNNLEIFINKNYEIKIFFVIINFSGNTFFNFNFEQWKNEKRNADD